MNEKLVSIVIPVFNVENYIEECLNSIINQSYKNLEILIIDDRGSDESISIARRFAMLDGRIEILHNPYNMGLLHSRLQGDLLAKGEYLLYLDSDDYYLDRDAIALMVEKMEGGFDCVQCNFTQKAKEKKLAVLEKENIANGQLRWTIWNKIYRTKIIKQKAEILTNLVPLGLNMCEDVIQSLVMQSQINKALIITNTLIAYRSNPKSMTLNRKNLKSNIISHDIALKIIEELENSSLKENKQFQKLAKIYTAKLKKEKENLIKKEQKYKKIRFKILDFYNEKKSTLQNILLIISISIAVNLAMKILD